MQREKSQRLRQSRKAGRFDIEGLIELKAGVEETNFREHISDESYVISGDKREEFK